MSDDSLGTCLQYSLVVDEDNKKPKKPKPSGVDSTAVTKSRTIITSTNTTTAAADTAVAAMHLDYYDLP